MYGGMLYGSYNFSYNTTKNVLLESDIVIQTTINDKILTFNNSNDELLNKKYNFFQKIIPKYYFNSNENLNVFLLILSEFLKDSKSDIDLVLNFYNVDNTFNLFSKILFFNFGFDFPINNLKSKKNFVKLVRFLISQKNSIELFQVIIGIYGYESEITERFYYFPKCGDTTSLGSLLCGEISPVIKCGVDNFIDNNHKLSSLCNGSGIVEIKIINISNVEELNEIKKIIDFFKPIHISIVYK